MLLELPYRIAVEETFIQAIRNNVITLITPVIEVDGREKHVDTYYFNKKRPGLLRGCPHVLGQPRRARQQSRRHGPVPGADQEHHQDFPRLEADGLHDLSIDVPLCLDWHGSYNEQIDPITIDEWWLLPKTEVMEMTKRGVPGVWTMASTTGGCRTTCSSSRTHNAIGRFYEVASYGPDLREQLGGGATSREWFRPNPPLPSIKWGPRNNTNIQQSALLIALNHVGEEQGHVSRKLLDQEQARSRAGKTGPTYGWIIPAGQRRKQDAADAVNELRRQGLEVHRATNAFKAGTVRSRRATT